MIYDNYSIYDKNSISYLRNYFIYLQKYINKN